jgi:uncharacterized protein DUF262/schlafen family protein
MSVTPQGKSIQTLYRDYREGNLLVNRRYQRKLVWTVEEKQRLIDSILKGYPIPLILLAEISDIDGKKQYEIIDGIQRFNAVFTFIENAFDYDNRFFNIDEFARARQLADEGLFAPIDNAELLTPEECSNILDYQLAITVYPASDESKVTDVFARINSGGRQLSLQEQRQAGVVSDFSRFIRTLSSELRGDVSKDVLLLSEMPEISVDSAKQPHGYGIQAEQTFWCSQGIMSVKQLKESEDEQVLADISASILKAEPLAASKELFDKIYDKTTDEGIDIEQQLVAYGAERLASEIKATLSIIKDVIETESDEANFLRNLVRPGSRYPIRTPFYAIFMAFFDLIVNQKKSPDQPDKIIGALKELDAKLAKGAHYETTENRLANINLTKGLVQDYFVDKVPPILGHGPSLVIDFENSLRRSRIETSRYEFKQGILRLDNNRDTDHDLLVRLTHTACGIANLGPDSAGYIFIGVADREEHVDRIQNLDGVAKRKIADSFLVGVDREAQILSISLEEYVKMIVNTFQQAEITEPLKTQILSSFDTINAHGLSVVRIRIPPQTECSFVNGEAYYRQDSNTIKIEGQQLVAVAKMFNK